MYNRRPLTDWRAFPVLETERANVGSILCGHTKCMGDWHVLANIPTFPERGAIKAVYRVVYLDPDYQTTIIGRKKLDYFLMMSRDPNFSGELLICLSIWLFDRAMTGN